MKVLNDQLTEEYCREAGQVIRANTQGEKSEDYGEKTSFQEVKNHWREFVEMIGANVEENQGLRGVELMEGQVRRWRQVRDCPCSNVKLVPEVEKLEKQADYLYEIKQYKEALEQYQESLQERK